MNDIDDDGRESLMEILMRTPAGPEYDVYEVIHGPVFRRNMETGELDRIPADVKAFLAEHPVGSVYRVHVSAPGTGFTEYTVVSYTDQVVCGVEIRNTVRILTPGDVK